MAHAQTVRSTCPYCGVGCGLLIQVENDRIIDVSGDPSHPANLGRLCTKGSTLLQSARPEGRLRHPELRRTRSAARQQASWPEALQFAATRFAEIIRNHGPDAVGFYLSGQLLTEDYYVFNKLAKGFIGTNNVDTNSRLCMSSAVMAYKQTLGADAPPCAYEDVEQADCVLIAGSNPAYAHPVLYRRLEAAKGESSRMKVIVVDPRRTLTAAAADLHLPILPGTDVWLFNAMLHVLIWEGHLDRDFIANHTTGFSALSEAVRDVTPSVAASLCGVPAQSIIRAARWWGEAKAPLSLWCQGLNQSHHGTHSGAALIALSLATGKIGKPGCGPFSLTGQPNAMGGREVGGMATMLSGHRDLGRPDDRAEVARLWDIPSVPEKPGLTAVEMFESARQGALKALWIVCTNPAHSMPQQPLIREALERCDFVVVQEAYATTETAAFADLLLPASTWGEKNGTVTNSERRITRVHAAVAPPGDCRADWQIARDFGFALGELLGRAGDARRLLSFQEPEAVFREHVETTRGRDLDITGLSYHLLDTCGPQQWPFPAGAREGKKRLYPDGVFPTADGRARFVVPVTTLTREKTDSRFPLRLTTGRLRDQWHTLTRTGRVPQLWNHAPEPGIELNAGDMERRGIAPGSLVKVSNPRGSVVLKAFPSTELAAGQSFIAMHWGRGHLNSSGANELTLNEFDPYSKQPELKHAAIRVEPAHLPYKAVFLRTACEEEAATSLVLELADRLAPLLPRFGYAALRLAGRSHPVLVLQVAHDKPISPDWLVELDSGFGLQDDACISYHDPLRHITKKALVERERLTGIRLSGETAAAAWLENIMVENLEIAGLRRWLLAPMSMPPDRLPPTGRAICNCHNVTESQIVKEIRNGATLDQLKASLRCGTQCGSCLPEITQMIREAALVTVP
ncbi:MAG: molybdopterin-dependent oxidoreductase [Betaproteobacteria bacterium]|nr:molybdopterin-dependent oxidoreductase [Betaproteobacteria bacterium]MDE2622469.1 molybdopterin-dependent oxidoreductase [Betaproteobacteria bacterium]